MKFDNFGFNKNLFLHHLECFQSKASQAARSFTQAEKKSHKHELVEACKIS